MEDHFVRLPARVGDVAAEVCVAAAGCFAAPAQLACAISIVLPSSETKEPPVIFFVIVSGEVGRLCASSWS